jgi:hypothetical protein
MTRDDIMHLVNETAPRYESWGCEAHFQLFAKRLMEREREACADFLERGVDLSGLAGLPEWQRFTVELLLGCAAAIRATGEQ